MKVCFHIHYQTQWGESIKICGSLPALGKDQLDQAPVMEYQSDGWWTYELEWNALTPIQFSYSYIKTNETQAEGQAESGKPRHIHINPKNKDSILLRDSWQSPGLQAYPWMTSAFTQVLMRRTTALAAQRANPSATHRFQVVAPLVPDGEVLCLVGSDAALGNWDTAQSVKMDGSQFPLWKVDVKLSAPQDHLSYKYACLNPTTGVITAWENGEDRHLESITTPKTLVIRSDEPYRQPTAWKGAGVAMPVFSLRSKKGMGVGEFPDIKLLVDWASQTQMKVVQILPVNDTIATHTWTDSYPYSAISVFALHPIYLNLETMGKLKSAAQRKKFEAAQKTLNTLEVVDFEEVMKTKSQFFKLLFKQEKNAFLKDPGFKDFFAENKDWLLPYAAFCTLRDTLGTVDFFTWGTYSTYDKKAIEKFAAPKGKHYDEIARHYFIQYHLHLQMADATAYARQKGVVLKGDIPIGICRNSVDSWVAPHLYNMDTQTGAPPDAFAVTGQNWGFPTYNWAEMAKDGYAWWRMRLSKMAAYFDAYRIDHVLGFFRIWEIPRHAIQGLFGHFNPALPLNRQDIESCIGWFDTDRLCRPYIRAHMLAGLFGPYEAEVRKSFLTEHQPGHFRLISAVDTERKIQDLPALSPTEKGKEEKNARIREGLYSLTNEILFLEGEEPHTYNPRISFHHTRSFQDLPDRIQEVLTELYVHYFYHRQESFWREQAMTKLPAIVEATDMLVCGEDLGMVPACVSGVMDELSILSLEIQRMPKDSSQGEFGQLSAAPYMSVVSPSSHDMSTIRGWWEEDSAITQRFFTHQLGHHGEAPEFCEPWISREIINQHLHTPAMWAIFPLQDLIGMDGLLRNPNPHIERINNPGNPNHYWQYRLHLPLEDLLKKRAFNESVKEIVLKSGR